MLSDGPILVDSMIVGGSVNGELGFHRFSGQYSGGRL